MGNRNNGNGKEFSGKNGTSGFQVNPELEKVNALIEANKLEKALDALQRMLARGKTENGMAQCQLGIVYTRKGDLVKAEKAFLSAVAENADLPEAFFNLGCLYQQKEDYGNALVCYKETLNLLGDDAEVFELMGDCCIAMDNPTDARAFYDAAIKMNPISLNAAANLATIYFSQGQKSEAKEILRLALVSHPKVPEIHMTLGQLHKEDSEYENAIAHFRKVALYDEDNAEAFFELGECCEAIGLSKQAEPFFAKAIKLDSENLDYIFSLGLLYYNRKRYNDAATMFQQWFNNFIVANPYIADDETKNRFLEVVNMLAYCYQKMKELSKARELWKLSLDTDANQPEIQRLFNEAEGYSCKRVSLVLD
jgi:tetratricopeptide (TPR) repeat protein